ncbi:MAG: DNA mismatch repair protein MutT [Promethearchaeota archaeon]|nr:MAG: DNA mismatch repair protein MutT [Candidatus Lokiarchaeota archaeon]
MSAIKTKAICIFSHDGKILVSEYTHTKTGEPFYRPLGGNIEFTEDSQQALKREIIEELNTPISNLELLDVIENIYYYKDKYSHEILFIYDGILEERSLYEREEFFGYEKEDSRKFKVKWKSLHDFASGRDMLYPEGLLELLTHKISIDKDYGFLETQESNITIEQ